MTRDEAISKLKKPAYDKETIKNDFEFISNKLSIETSELKKYMTISKKTYKDFKSQDKIYNIGAKAMRIAGLEVGGKR